MNAQDGLIRTLEPRYYTDPEIFRVEMEGLLARTWQFAGHVSQVAMEKRVPTRDADRQE